MDRRLAVVAGVVALVVVAYLVWWPGFLQALQGLHGAFGGPGMHGLG